MQCCIVGGGPAGMMLGLLLARAGVTCRCSRSTRISCATSAATRSIPRRWSSCTSSALLDGFLKLPHQEVRELAAQVGEATVRIADFTHLPTQCRFMAFMPQWDFLISWPTRRGGTRPSACGCAPRSPT